MFVKKVKNSFSNEQFVFLIIIRMKYKLDCLFTLKIYFKRALLN